MSHDWQAAYERLKSRTEREEERGWQMIALAIDDVAGYAGSALMGWIHGRRGGMAAIGGVPLDAGLGGFGALVGWGLTLAGYSQYGRPVASFGRSTGGYWVASLFADMGQKAREKAGEKVNRQLTTEEAQKAKVVVRPPITGARRGSGYALREELYSQAPA